MGNHLKTALLSLPLVFCSACEESQKTFSQIKMDTQIHTSPVYHSPDNVFGRLIDDYYCKLHTVTLDDKSHVIEDFDYIYASDLLNTSNEDVLRQKLNTRGTEYPTDSVMVKQNLDAIEAFRKCIAETYPAYGKLLQEPTKTNTPSNDL